MKLIRFVIVTIELFVCFVLQNIVTVDVGVGNVIPDMLMVIVCGMAFMFGSTAGVVYGFMAGLLIDITTGNLGLTAFFFSATGFLAGYSRKFYSRANTVLPLAIIAVAEFAYLTVYYVVNFMTRGRAYYAFVLKSIILPRVTLTVLVGVLLYKLCQMSVLFTKTKEA